MEASSVGELLLLHDPWPKVASTASGRFAREIDTKAFPSRAGQFHFIHTVEVNERTGQPLLELLFFFPDSIDLVQYLQSLGWGNLATDRLVGFFESTSSYSMAGA